MSEIISTAMAAPSRPPEPAPEPPDARRRRTRDRLVESALLVLGRRSADASIIDELTALAGVSRGTFYNYFRTNDELLAAVAEEAGNELMRAVHPITREVADPAARVALGVRLVLTVAGAHPEFARFVARVGPAALGAGSLAAEIVPFDLAEGVAAGRFRIDDPKLAFDLVVGPVLAAFDTLQHRPLGQAYVDALAGAVLRALGVPGATATRLATRPLPSLRLPDTSLIARTEARARRVGLSEPHH
jgi:AcrR family transcriptional regulator